MPPGVPAVNKGPPKASVLSHSVSCKVYHSCSVSLLGASSPCILWPFYFTPFFQVLCQDLSGNVVALFLDLSYPSPSSSSDHFLWKYFAFFPPVTADLEMFKYEAFMWNNNFVNFVVFLLITFCMSIFILTVINHNMLAPTQNTSQLLSYIQSQGRPFYSKL